MKHRIKRYFLCAALLALYVIINYYYVQHIYNNKQIHQSGEKYSAREEYVFTPHFG